MKTLLALLLSTTSAFAGTAVVSGFTTPDIHAAAVLAGDGGTVEFLDGLYDSDGLTVSIPNQTWKLNHKTTIKRSCTTSNPVALTVSGANFRIRGGTIDGSRSCNPLVTNSFIVVAQGFNAENTIFQSSGAWGLALYDGLVYLNRVTVRDTNYACVIFTNGSGSGIVGPQIDRLLCDRSNENPITIISGGVLIQDTRHTYEFILRPSITNSVFIAPATHKNASGVENDAVGLEVLYAQRATIQNNVFIGWRIGVTWAGGFGSVTGNNCQLPSSYCIELGSHDSIIMGNTGSGYYSPSGPESAGITVNPVVKNDKIIGNTMRGWTKSLDVKPGAVLDANWAN